MSEADFQMALVMQYKFEQEAKSKKLREKSDEDLARTLQEHFEHESNIENPSSLVYENKSKPITNASKCLTDPSWELVDPTPDIHILFVAFNERFFWNKLHGVCVSWSKRMTTCAGICSYQGAGGMCSITLSEPLLKLRPRKDLVETLLHEMIHALLFVTRNNKDRDGHGPEFHKHMYRINKESGTNITVYHSFHDEVNLYKQHHWRCDGPCKDRKPFFGWVKRATNRAPGPNDFWYAEHSRNCGGTFIKVQEPEKPQNRKKEKQPAAKPNAGDIRKFIQTENNLPNTNHSSSPFKINGDTSKTNNVTGFKDLNKKPNGRFNSTSTIVVTKTSTTTKESSKSSSESNPTVSIINSHGLSGNVRGLADLNNGASTSQAGTEFKPTVFNKQGNINNPGSKQSTDDNKTHEFLSVRDHWQNKFGNNSEKPPKKRPSTEIPEISANKLPKLDEACCPVCNENIACSAINRHLDECLSASGNDDVCKIVDELKSCPICNGKLSASKYDAHVADCLLKVHEELEKEFGDIIGEIKSESKENVAEKTECLACGKEISKSQLNAHLEECASMSAIFDNDDDFGNDVAEKTKFDEFECPICLEKIDVNEMEAHIDACVNNSIDEIKSVL